MRTERLVSVRGLTIFWSWMDLTNDKLVSETIFYVKTVGKSHWRAKVSQGKNRLIRGEDVHYRIEVENHLGSIQIEIVLFFLTYYFEFRKNILSKKL